MYKRIRKALFDYFPAVVKTSILARAPFLYEALEIHPTSCNIMLTNRCNLRCVMCKQWRERPQPELSTEQWRRVIDDLKGNGFRNIHFTGGEPLLRQDLEELVSFANARGFVVGMTTNGTLLTAEVLQRLVKAGLRSVALSIDAVGDRYEAIRGMEGAFARLGEAVSAIAAARRTDGIDAYINFTLMKSTIASFPEVKAFADANGLPVGICLLDKASSIFDLAENSGRFWIDKDDDAALGRFLDLLKKEVVCRPGSLLINFPGIDFIPMYFSDPRSERIPCAISQDRTFIDPYGNVLGGCLAMGSFGNLKEFSFKNISGSSKYRTAKRNMFYKRCPGCSCGYMFNIRHMPGLVLADIGTRLKHIFAKG